ncbi:MAG TPA: porphobilinogen synthase [Candidatus Saccharimonadales bacterium]|nr:porphobilinogen synthase [Candidatus Saccharimonadales bacterium]
MSGFPITRLRRLRNKEALRNLVAETKISVASFIYPLFISEEISKPQAISAMPGMKQWTIDTVSQEAQRAFTLGIPAVLLFGIPKKKDAVGTQAYAKTGVIQKAIKQIKKTVPDLLIITDVCLCEYTDHGHCGVIQNKFVQNDPTLKLLSAMALSHVQAGADMVAPSDMMDGRIGDMRKTLDTNGFTDTPIMAYSAKYASGFYGPFREAAQSAPQFGDRKTYQMDPRNVLEAIHETELDIQEGADIIMVKPAMPYLDVIYRVKQTFNVPLAAYNVSGEYSMIKAAAQNGWIDEKRIVMEVLTGIKRAGADIIITYFAPQVAQWLKNK